MLMMMTSETEGMMILIDCAGIAHALQRLTVLSSQDETVRGSHTRSLTDSLA